MVVVHNIDGTKDTSNAAPAPEPNNEGNVWFGKTPLPTDDFWGLVQKAQIAVALSSGGTREDGLDAMGRLLNSTRAAGLREIINTNALIDPDDRNGDFMEALETLTTVNHETDGNPLMSVTWDDGALDIQKRTPTGGVVGTIFSLWPSA